MELTAHGVWTMVHGMGFGALLDGESGDFAGARTLAQIAFSRPLALAVSECRCWDYPPY